MQAYNDGELFSAMTDNFNALVEQKKALLSSGKADNVVIASLPEVGTEVEINGLVFMVTRTNEFGKIIMMLKRS